MNRSFFIVISVCVILLSACGGGKNEYTVKGVVPEYISDGEKVYMTDYNEGFVTDSTKVADGKFAFKGVFDEPKAVRITLGQHNINLIIERGVITLDMLDPYGTKGSRLTEKFNKFLSESEKLVEDAREKLMNIDISASDEEMIEEQEEIVDELLVKMDELSLLYIKEHPNDVLGAMVFSVWMQNQMEPSAEKYNEYSAFVGEFVLNYGPVKQMAEYFNTLGKTAVGELFVDFTIEKGNIDGSSSSLSDYVGKGKYVLVDFWASWCAPCREETSVIKEVYSKYKGDRFDVVSVAVWDNREATIKAIEDDGNKWHQIIDAQTIPTELYGIQGIPHIILFGPDGTIIARDLRGIRIMDRVSEALNDGVK